VRRVQDVHAVWQADRELWVTLAAGDRDAAEAAGFGVVEWHAQAYNPPP
jgi:hypothetical protein